jgi:hypothetical protein
MKISLSKTILISASFAMFFLLGIGPSLAANEAITGLEQTVGQTPDLQAMNKQSLPQTIGTIIGAGLAFIGVIFFILIIYGGFIWMIARGNEQEVHKAKDIITAAVTGLIIVVCAYAITAFVGQLIGQTST